MYRAGRSFARYFKPRDIVAQLDRKIERRFGLASLRRKGVAGFADRGALWIDRADNAGGKVQEGYGKVRRKVGDAIEDVGDAIKR